jgi:hypothetical protein
MYIRNGYVDPYERFQVDAPKDKQVSSIRHEESFLEPETAQTTLEIFPLEQPAAPAEGLSLSHGPTVNFDFSTLELGMLSFPLTPSSQFGADDWVTNVSNFNMPPYLAFPFAQPFKPDSWSPTSLCHIPPNQSLRRPDTVCEGEGSIVLPNITC